MQIRSTSRLRQIAGTAASLVLGAGVFVLAQAPSSSSLCVVTGRVTSAGTPLPGVSILTSRSGGVVSATSTDTDGSYRLRVPPGEYTVAAELVAFAKFERPLVVTPDSCAPTLDVALDLVSRTQPNSSATAPA
ncbi:MAG TPA: carboxypeptidase-like regulatory domain-containing protein, partial [Vicinamibacterales bacterium]|nr:carboxypeptidase-like regulatory domain-containing protein [Vicinamibacterales bacterium]